MAFTFLFNSYQVGGGGGSEYTLPAATTTTLGGVIVPTAGNLDVDESGNISVPIATDASLGVVQPDGSTITIDEDGVISAVGGGYTLPAATTTTLGGVIVPTAGNLDVDGSGNLSVPIATDVSLGVVQPDTIGTAIQQVASTITAVTPFSSNPTASSNASEAITFIDPTNGLSYTVTMDIANVQFNTYYNDGVDAPSLIGTYPITDGVTPSVHPSSLAYTVLLIGDPAVNTYGPYVIILVADITNLNLYTFTCIAGVIASQASALNLGFAAATMAAAIIQDTNWLFITDMTDGLVSVYEWSNGNEYTASPSSNVTTGNVPLSLSLRGNGQYLDVTNGEDSTISSYTWSLSNFTYQSMETVSTPPQGTESTLLSTDQFVILINPESNSVSVYLAAANILTLSYTYDLTSLGTLSNRQNQGALYEMGISTFLSLVILNGSSVNQLVTFQVTSSTLINSNTTMAIGGGGSSDITAVNMYQISSNENDESPLSGNAIVSNYLAVTNQSQSTLSVFQITNGTTSALVADIPYPTNVIAPNLYPYPYASQCPISGKQFRGQINTEILGLSALGSQVVTLAWSIPFTTTCTRLFINIQEPTSTLPLAYKIITPLQSCYSGVEIEIDSISATSPPTATVTIYVDAEGY